MQVNAYLHFNGNCAAAFKFYEKVLGGKIVMMQSHGDTPAAGQVAPEMRDKIIHVRLEIGDQVLMGSDAPPEHYRAPQGFAVTISVPTPPEGARIFNALAENGKVTMPYEKTFWSTGFGITTDRFGTPWMVNCVQEPAAAGA